MTRLPRIGWASALALGLSLALPAGPAHALDLAASDAGFVSTAGGSAKGDGPVARYNHSVGWELHYADGAPPPPLVAQERRNYFVFDLAAVAAPIASASLKLWTGELESADASETLVLLAPADQAGTRADALTLFSAPYPGGFDSPGDMAVAVAASLFAKLGSGPAPLATVAIGHGDPKTPLLVLGLVPEPASALLMLAGLGLLLALRLRRRRAPGLLAAALALTPALSPAAELVLASTQVGGFYADGGHDNLAGFQNYFVGYGTTPGSARTAERRSFFVFDLSGLAGPVSAASFSLTMPAFGVIGDEPSEVFVLSASPAPATAMLDPVVTPGIATAIFGTLGTGALVAPELGIDVGAPPSGMVLTMVFNAAGLAAVNAPHPGGLLVLGGRMASWSFDPDPLHEPHELLFGHSDVMFFGTPIVAKPLLTVTVVPEPAAWALLLPGGLLLLLARRRRGTR